MESQEDSICIVQTSAVTAIGLDANSTAAAVRAGIDGFEEHPSLLNKFGEPYVLAMVPAIEKASTTLARYLHMAEHTLQEVLTPLSAIKDSQVGVVALIALPEKRPGLPDTLHDSVANLIEKYNCEKYLFKDVRTAYSGHFGGIAALKKAREVLDSGDCDFCVVGGVDSYIDPDTLAWIESNEQLHNANNAWGFIPGEASGFILITKEKTAQKYGLASRAKIMAAATANEENRIKTETVCLGHGLTQAMKSVTSGLAENTKIDNMICDQNGEPYRADEFGFTMARLGNFYGDSLDVQTPADCWGDVGAASGPLFVSLVTIAAEKNYSAGPISMIWSSSEGGGRAAALLITPSKTG